MKLISVSILLFQLVQSSKIQIKPSGNENICLTYSSSQTMGAYNPASADFSNYVLATWETCVDFATNQQFEYELATGRLIANGQCLTPLPINEQFHENLDPCDTWKFFDGAGTYLFASDCIDTPSPVAYQQFTYDPSGKTLTSNCNHGHLLGSILDQNQDYRSFLTSADGQNTFPSAQVLTGFNISLATYVEINQPRNDAVLDILSEFLTTSEYQDVIQHGCWCTKMSGFNPDYAGEPIDEVDGICRDWSYQRRCNQLVGGTCPIDTFNYQTGSGYQYVIDRTFGGDNYSCDTTENIADACLFGSCTIDGHFAKEIYDYLQSHPDWSNVVAGTGQCARAPPVLTDRICNGTLPFAEIIDV